MKRVFFCLRFELFFSDVKKVEFLLLKSFLLKITNSSPISIFLFFNKSLDIQEWESCFMSSSNQNWHFWYGPTTDIIFEVFRANFSNQLKITVRGRNFLPENSQFRKVQILNFHWKKIKCFWLELTIIETVLEH